MSVPEAPVDKDDLATSLEDDVRPPRKPRIVEPVAEAGPIQQLPHSHFRRRVAAPHSPHIGATGLGG